MKSDLHAQIEPGDMAFLAKGREGIGSVRAKTHNTIVIYIENAGDFLVPASAVCGVHDQKVILDPAALGEDLLKAVGHTRDHEEPDAAG